MEGKAAVRISVKTSKPYEVLIGSGLIQNVPALISTVCKSSRAAIVTDDIVSRLYLHELRESLRENGFEAVSFAFPNGEQSKNICVLSDILEFLAFHRFRRNDTIIALGGGVVGDIAGMAAAVYMRGISVIQIPTTLLAAVDSSVGGKTAIDLKNGKNLAGAFWQPGMVVCDADIMGQLPDEIFAEGMAEVIKCNVIKDLPLIGWIEKDELKRHLMEVISACVALKRDVVEQDEFDQKGIRNILNVGHTAAHAIEKLSGYTISHGHAVGTGMVIEAEIAAKLGICENDTVDRIRTAVGHYGLMVDTPWTSEQIAEAMMSDKKNRDTRIVFELPRFLGSCEEIKLEKETLIPLLKHAIER